MRTAIALVLAAVFVAACGDADSNSDPQDSTPLSATTEPSGSSTTTGRPTTSTAPPPPAGAALSVTDGVQRAGINPDAPVSELAAGWNDAGFDLLRRLPAEDNVVFSPASIGHALQMAAAAGDDATRTAIESAFNLPGGSHEAWNSLDQAIAGSQTEQVTVTIADRIWPSFGIEPDQQWVDLLAAQLGTDVVPLDYVNEPDVSRDIINDWVSDRTEGLIPDLLPAGFIHPQTVLVLTDTVYFAADWAQPFGKYGPVDGTFTTVDGRTVDVSFMQELELADRRGVGDGYVGAEIPYAGNEYSMLVLVPDAGRYDEFIDRLDQQLLDEIDATFTTGPYELLLPKWDDNYQIDLLDWLTGIGAAPGSYPKITPGAFLDAAVHAADIAVDERGTVAAAATALGFAESGPPEPELTVAADRPFVYLIRHRETGLVLFAGHVTDPVTDGAPANGATPETAPPVEPDAASPPETISDDQQVVPGVTYLMEVGTHCGVTRIGLPVNDILWITDEPGASERDWMPIEWSSQLEPGEEIITVEIVLSPEESSLTATKAGRSVVYRPLTASESGVYCA